MDSLNQLLKLSGIRASGVNSTTSRVQQFEFNRAKNIAEFLVKMSEDLPTERKQQLIAYVKEAMKCE